MSLRFANDGVCATELFDVVHWKEVEFVKYIKDGAYYVGVLVRDANGNEYVMGRHQYHHKGTEYNCICIVDNEWLDACTENWHAVWLDTPAPAGYEFVNFRYPHECGMNHLALRRRTDEEMREIREWNKKIAEYDAYLHR